MKNALWVMVVLLSLGVCGCSVRMGPTKAEVTPLKPGPALSMQGKKLFVAMPADFKQGESVEKDSGMQTQQALQKKLQKRGVDAVYADTPREKAQSLEAATRAGTDYLLDMSIIEWKDPPASFQIVPDKGEVSLVVLDTGTGDIIRHDNITCSGMATTVNTIGFYSPKDCLAVAFEKWIDAALDKNTFSVQ